MLAGTTDCTDKKTKPQIAQMEKQNHRLHRWKNKTTDYLARPLAATKFEFLIADFEIISNDKKLNAQNFT